MHYYLLFLFSITMYENLFSLLFIISIIHFYLFILLLYMLFYFYFFKCTIDFYLLQFIDRLLWTC